uniref:Uncharacterized protein n=1 Tax=Arundo donax TaxID=35708 RepID=A0A0A9AUA2_ARUDO
MSLPCTSFFLLPSIMSCSLSHQMNCAPLKHCII